MNAERKMQLEKELRDKCKEILQIVGDDLPTDGFVSVNVWERTILIKIMRGWEHAPASDRTLFDYYVEI